MKDREVLLAHINTTYAYQFAKKMEQYRCHPELGYRTAGSKAERQTGEMIAREMERIGLKDVKKDKVKLDGWTFRKAHLSFKDAEGKVVKCELGGYQTQFDTHGIKEYTLVYLNKGVAEDYKDKDVTGKLVLIDINQRDEWWINFPVYQAHLKGAAAVLAVQKGGYGQVHSEALNAQDIAGPSQAPAFSISKRNAAQLKKVCKQKGEMKVLLDASSTINPDTHSYNIVGKIPGQLKERMILFSAHYDSYFTGFQDDNAAIGMLLGIAKAVIMSGYKPLKTWVFCAMAAEEWGVINSKYDWSTGAYEEVFTLHPQWHGKVDVDFNFELPAYAHEKRDYIRCIYEYQLFIKSKLKNLQPSALSYPKGAGVVSPIVTWSDDFSMAINGIPSMVNDFSQGHFMETHYHSQFDNKSVYNEHVYRYHHELYMQLGLCYDQLILVPMQFRSLFQPMIRSLKKIEGFSVKKEKLIDLLETAGQAARKVYRQIKKVNEYGEKLAYTEVGQHLAEIVLEFEEINEKLLALFKIGQDEWVRLNWHDEVFFPHTVVSDNLNYVKAARSALQQQEVKAALKALYHIDNNRYAFLFEKEVYDYFTLYATNQEPSRLKWGYKRLMPHENLFDLVQRLKAAVHLEQPDLREEIAWLREVEKREETLLGEVLQQEIDTAEYLLKEMESLKEKLKSIKLDEL